MKKLHIVLASLLLSATTISMAAEDSTTTRVKVPEPTSTTSNLNAKLSIVRHAKEIKAAKDKRNTDRQPTATRVKTTTDSQN